MKILGIDPGTNRLGYAVIESKPLKSLVHGLFEVKGKDEELIFSGIERGVSDLIREWHPAAVAIENLYFSKNQKTALQVAEIRGVIKLLAFKNKLPLYEIDPKTVKLSVTGYGNSDKISVAKMVSRIFKIEEKLIDDVTDAIAIAYVGSNFHRQGLRIKDC